MIKAQHTVPGTNTNIVVSQSVRGYAVMVISYDEIVPDWSRMARDEKGARKIANELWTEIVKRRNAVKINR